MTNYSATVSKSSSGAEIPNHPAWQSRLNTSLVDEGLVVRTLSAIVAHKSADKTISIHHNAKIANYHRTYFTVFYNQIHVIPNRIDLGSVSSDSAITFSIWNGYLSSVDFSNASGFEVGQGVSLLEPSLPVAMKPLGIEIVTLGIAASGSPTINLNLLLTFSTSTYLLNVQGSRSKLFPFAHNWGKSDYSVEYEFKTEVWESRSGKEQRRGYRKNPRRKIEGEYAVYGSNLTLFNRLMDSWQHNRFAIPELSRKAYIESSTALTVTLENASPQWIIPNSSVVLRQGKALEIRRVVSVVGSLVTFSSPSTVTWEAGSAIHPLLTTYIDSSTDVNVLTDSVESMSVTFDVVPGGDVVRSPSAATQFFNGYELFHRHPNWRTTPKLTFTVRPEDVDFGFGLTARYNPVSFGTRALQLGYTNANEQASNEIIDLFLRMAGQLGEFYMPTWISDIRPEFVSPSGSRLIRFVGDDFVNTYGGSTVHRAISIYYSDGTVQHTQIVSIVELIDLGSTYSVMTTSDDLMQEVSPENVKHISWLLRWRFATDQLTVQWLTDEKSQIQITVKSLEALA